MFKITLAAAIFLMFASAAPALAAPAYQPNLAPDASERANIAVVEAFMTAMAERKDRAAVEALLADDFVSRNPQIKGKAGMAGFADYLKEKSPTAKVVEVFHTFAKGDIVVHHYLFAHDSAKPADTRVVDFYRVRDGKIVEYWDVLQRIGQK